MADDKKEHRFSNKKVPVNVDESNTLREGIEKEYKVTRNGIVELDAKTKNAYEEVGNDFSKKFENQKIIIHIKTARSGEQECNKPETMFLFNLFHQKRGKEFSSKKYNIDMSYLYAFNTTREAYWQLKKNESANNDANSHLEFNGVKVIISTLHHDHLVAENLKSQLEQKFFHKVDIDIRDIKAYHKGRLQELYDNNNESMILFLIVGKRNLQNADCLHELLELKEKNPQKLSHNTVVIGLEDVCDGEYSILSTGKIKIVEYWTDHVEGLDNFISKQNKKLSKRQNKHPNITLAKNHKDGAEKIIDNITALIDFILNESTFTPHKLMDTYFTRKHINKVLNRQIEAAPKKGIKKRPNGPARPGWASKLENAPPDEKKTENSK